MNATDSPHTTATDDSSEEPGPSPSTRSKPEPPKSMPVTIVLQTDPPPQLDTPWLVAHIADATPLLPDTSPLKSIEIAVLDDQQMQELHQSFCGIEQTTDVLTFHLSETGKPLEANIAVCLDVATRSADRVGHPIEAELLLYILHGLLHCCGYNDHDEVSYTAMHAEEDRILEAIGVGRLFSRGSSNYQGDRRTHIREKEQRL